MTLPHQQPYASVLETIGWTPLIRLSRIGCGIRTPIYGKAEYTNPGGSVKDRIGLAIIEGAERSGELKPEARRALATQTVKDLRAELKGVLAILEGNAPPNAGAR